METRMRAPSRSGERTNPTAPPGRRAASSAGRMTSSTSTVTVRRAAPPVRRRPVFRLLRSCPATSSATLGRASKFAPTVPIGIRRSLTRKPFGSVQAAASRSSGSTSAVSTSWSASAATRASSSRSRSSVPSSSRPDASSTSAALAARISRRCSPMSRAAPRKASATAPSVSDGRAAPAARASSSTCDRRVTSFRILAAGSGRETRSASREAEGPAL